MANIMGKKRKGTVLIVGAAKGLGYELARLYAKAGHHLVLADKNGRRLGRTATALKKAHGIDALAVVRDLSEVRSADRLARTLKEARQRVDILVDRAGYRIYGPFSDSDLLRELRRLATAFRTDPAANAVGFPVSLSGRLRPLPV